MKIPIDRNVNQSLVPFLVNLKFLPQIIVVFYATFIFILGCENKPVSPKPTGSPEQKTIKWRLQSQAPASNADFIELMKFCKNIKMMTDNMFIITPYSARELVSGPKIFDAVKEGRIEMGLGWPNWWIKYDIGWAALQGEPFGFMNIDASILYFYEDEGIKLANELSRPHGILWRPAWWAGMEFGILTNFPAFSIDDLKNKKIRIGPGLSLEILKIVAGCEAVAIPPEKLKRSLNSRDIDGVEWTVPGATLSMNFHSVTTHALCPAIWQPATVADFLINLEAFNKLPERYKTILEVAMKEYALRTTFRGKRQDILAMQRFKKSGLVITKWSSDDLEKWKKASDTVIEKYCNESATFKKIIESKRAFKNLYREYYHIYGPYDVEFERVSK